MPDSVVLAFIPSAPGSANENNFIMMDDIAPVPAAPGIPHTGFENWNDYSVLALSSWFYPGNAAVDTFPLLFVEQAIFNAPDDYAAELHNIHLANGHWACGELSNRPPTLSKETTPGGFPVYAQHRSLNGYYKWFPDGDTMLIDVQLLHEGGQIAYGQFTSTTPASDFTMFDIPLTYTVSGVTPDTAEILIRCSTRNPVHGDSHLFIDKLSFDGFTGLEDNSGVSVPRTAIITVFPNPASAEVTIQLSEAVNGKLSLYDLHGKVVYAEGFTGSKALLDTHTLSRGLYFVSVEESGRRVVTRLVVVR
jgi:hypothetical protein